MTVYYLMRDCRVNDNKTAVTKNNCPLRPYRHSSVNACMRHKIRKVTELFLGGRFETKHMISPFIQSWQFIRQSVQSLQTAVSLKIYNHNFTYIEIKNKCPYTAESASLLKQESRKILCFRIINCQLSAILNSCQKDLFNVLGNYLKLCSYPDFVQYNSKRFTDQ